VNASLFYMPGKLHGQTRDKMVQLTIRIKKLFPVKGCVDLKQATGNTWLVWAAPIIMTLMTMSALLIPPLLLLCMLLAVYFDNRLGGWRQTIVMGAVLALIGIWLWGTAGICLLLIALIPTVTAIISLRQKVSFGEGLIYSFAAGLFSLVAAVFVLFAMYRQDPMSLAVDLIKETIRLQGEGSALVLSTIQTQAMVEWSMSLNYDLSGYMKLIDEMKALSMDDLLARIMPTYESFIRLYTPTVMVGFTMLTGLCSWVLPGFALKRRILKNKPVSSRVVSSSLPPSFVRWSIPRSVLLISTLLMAVSLFMQGISNMVIISSINALNFAAETVLLVQGVSFAAYWLRSKKMKVWLRWLIILIGLSLFYTIFVMLGLAEGTMQLRKMMMMRKHSVQMQELVMKYREDPRELDRHMREFMAKIEQMEEEEDFSPTPERDMRKDRDPEEEDFHGEDQDKE